MRFLRYALWMFLASNALAATGVTLRDSATNYMQILAPETIAPVYRMIVPSAPGTAGQRLSVGSVYDSSFTLTFSNLTGLSDTQVPYSDSSGNLLGTNNLVWDNNIQNLMIGNNASGVFVPAFLVANTDGSYIAMGVETTPNLMVNGSDVGDSVIQGVDADDSFSKMFIGKDATNSEPIITIKQYPGAGGTAVGISTATPAAMLDVNGTMIVRSSATFSMAVTASSFTLTTGGSAGKAICWKSATTLGYCSSAVGAGGDCTCN